jgi:capsular polysaccharide biosynthesis protein
VPDEPTVVMRPVGPGPHLPQGRLRPASGAPLPPIAARRPAWDRTPADEPAAPPARATPAPRTSPRPIARRPEPVEPPQPEPAPRWQRTAASRVTVAPVAEEPATALTEPAAVPHLPAQSVPAPPAAAVAAPVAIPEGYVRADSLPPHGHDAWASAGPSTPSWVGRVTRQMLASAVAVALVLGGLVGGALWLGAPTYRSTAKLIIDQPGALAIAQSDGVIAKLAQLRLKYVDLVGTPVIEDPTAVQAGLPVGQLGGTLAAAADPASLLLTVTADSGNAGRARTLADGAAASLSAFVTQEQVKGNVPANLRVTLTVVDPASKASKVSPSLLRTVLVAVVVALLAGAAALAFQLARRR